MSNLTQLVSANGPTVAPGTVTSAQLYTSVGWAAGEYIYQGPNGAITPRTTGGLGYNATYNGGTTLVGASWTPGTIQTIQYGPVLDFGTFAGTSQTAGTQVGSNTQLNSTASWVPYSFNLINGNVATVSSATTGGQVTLSINTPAGASVALIAISGATGNNPGAFTFGTVSGCCTTAGIVIVTWFDSNDSQHYYASFTQTGTVVQAKTSMGVGSSVRFHQTIALADGGWLTAGTTSNSAGTCNFATVSSTGTVTGPTSISSINADFLSCCLLTNGNVAVAGVNSSSANMQGAIINFPSRTTTNQSAFTSGNGAYANVVALPGNQFAVSYNNSSNQNRISVYNSSFVNISDVQTDASLSQGSTCALQLSATGAVTLFVLGGGAGGNLRLRTVTFPNGTSSAGTVTTLNTTIPVVNYMGNIVNSLNGRAVISFTATTTQFPNNASYATVTLTSGTTVLSGLTYSPKEGWIMLGVAATAVGAGGTGPVITNGGSVALNASYPLVTPTVNFNFQGAGGYFAQRGSVVNRVAFLEGLEA